MSESKTQQELDELSDHEIKQLERELDALLVMADNAWEVVKDTVGRDADNEIACAVAEVVDRTSDAARAVSYANYRRDLADIEESNDE